VSKAGPAGRQGPVPCPLGEAARERPEGAALEAPGLRLTYRELDRRVSLAAGRLREAGLGGRRVGLYLEGGAGYVILLLALLRAGAVACPVSTRLPPQGAAPLLRRAGCAAVVCAGPLPGLRCLRPEEILSGRPAEAPTPGPIPLDRPATVVFTSGSTGIPKAALHTFGNHYYSALGSASNIPLAPGDRWLLSLPLYHVGGLSIVFRCVLAGAAMVLPEPGAPLGSELRRRGITHASLVSTQLLRLLREGGEGPPEGLKAILLGASAMPAGLLEEAVSRGLPVHTSYGLTEMASQVAATRPGAPLEELLTSGRVLPHRELRLAEDGEILVRGRTLFAGYVEGDAVERPLDREGWFHTRDLGELDGEGRLLVRGRRDNLFVSGGENVQPEEIEEALRREAGAEEAVVVPVPDEEWGARPVAFLKGGAPDPARSLERVLPRFKIPVAFYPWPQDAPGGMKVDRAFFRERALGLRRRPRLC